MVKNQELLGTHCGVCEKQFHHTQVAVRCVGCKLWLHGACCNPVIRKRDAAKYQTVPFVCHSCADTRNLEGSVRDGSRGRLRTQTLRTSARPAGQPLAGVNVDQLIRRIEDLESQNEQLAAKLVAYEKRLADLTENGIFWDKLLEEKAAKFDDLIKKLAAHKSRALPEARSSECRTGMLDVIICNIPEVANEDTNNVARAVFKAVEPNVADEQVVQAARILSNGGNDIPLIKATVKDERTKGKIIKAAKLKKLSVNDIQLHAQLNRLSKGGERKWKDGALRDDVLARKVYINESTSKSTRELFYKVRKLRESGVIERAWTFRDSVFVRVAGRERPLCIRSNNDIDLLCAREIPIKTLQSVAPAIQPISSPSKISPASETHLCAVPTSNSFSVLSKEVLSSTPYSSPLTKPSRTPITLVANQDAQEDPLNTAILNAANPSRKN